MNSILIYWPTVLWAFGFIEFWIQLTVAGPAMHTSGVSVWLAFFLLAAAGFKQRLRIKESATRAITEVRQAPFLFKFLLGLAAVMLTLATFEARHPPNLTQESDPMVYHMAIPLQHLFAGTPAHLSWSAADLWPMPVQWGFAPFWFMMETFNKWPQAFVHIWLFALLVSLGRMRENEPSEKAEFRSWWPALAFMTTQGVMIQLGTAMLDLVNFYFLIAGFHAARRKKVFWSSLQFALAISAKSFSPLQMLAVAAATVAFFFIFQRSSLVEALKENRRIIAGSLFFSIVLLTRSAAVSLERAGTPLFPFAPCLFSSAPGCQDEAGVAIRESSKHQTKFKDAYGNGRSFKSLIRHFWRVAVPTEGVNNEFDYQMGLAWLLGWVLILFALDDWIRTRRLSMESVAALAFWIGWWMGSQQARWLYPFVGLAWLGTMDVQRRVSPKIMHALLIVSASFSLISEWRSMRQTVFLPSAVLQERETKKVSLNNAADVIDLKILYVKERLKTLGNKNPSWVLE